LATALRGALRHACWRDSHNNAASGVDRVSAEDYAQHLEANRRDLGDRWKRQTYRATRVRRHSIPNGAGRRRPFGIPAMEDRLVPLAVACRLAAIDAQDVRRGRDGYRPPGGPLEAVRTLTITRQFGRYGFVGEADLKGFFDTIDQAWLRRMVEAHLADKARLRLIQQWRNAGVRETDGQVLHPATGTPQGGRVSPLFANGYWHDALDLWCEKVVTRRCRGEACLIRDADDGVGAGEDHAAATACYPALGDRLGKFTLARAAEKTRSIALPRPQTQPRVACRGVACRWGTERSGKAQVKRRTSRTKLQQSLAHVTEWCRKSRHLRLRRRFERLNATLQGSYHDSGVKGHGSRLEGFYNRARPILLTWRNRRSQRRSRNGPGVTALLAHVHVPRPRITARPRTREAAAPA
jgi:RNA-directed DNA polymerase